ncbi:MAG: hypothetical protein ABL884_05680 [Methyloglobulus sp.]
MKHLFTQTSGSFFGFDFMVKVVSRLMLIYFTSDAFSEEIHFYFLQFGSSAVP